MPESLEDGGTLICEKEGVAAVAGPSCPVHKNGHCLVSSKTLVFSLTSMLEAAEAELVTWKAGKAALVVAGPPAIGDVPTDPTTVLAVYHNNERVAFSGLEAFVRYMQEQAEGLAVGQTWLYTVERYPVVR